MAYVTGGVITASDFNGFRDRLQALWGSGTGVNGYGQAGTLPSVTGGFTQQIGGAEWQALYTTYSTLIRHQGLDENLIPEDGSYDVGALVRAFVGDFDPDGDPEINKPGDLPNGINALETNRLIAGNLSITETSDDYEAAEQNLTASMSLTVDLEFPSVNAARYYFNCGGRIVVEPALDIPTAAPGEPPISYTPEQLAGLELDEFINQFSSMQLSALETKSTGEYEYNGIAGRNGYYNLPTTEQLIFDNQHTDVPEVISFPARFQVWAQTFGGNGGTGGNGNRIRLRMLLSFSGVTVNGTPGIYIRSLWPNIYLTTSNYTTAVITPFTVT